MSSWEDNIPSMENKWWLITAVAPVTWGANYLVIAHLFPPGSPLWGAALRSAPAAVLLLLWCRSLPRGRWWWRSAVLGVLNVGAFFLCIHLTAQLLPSSVAASIMALSPLVLGGFAWWLLSQRPSPTWILSATIGLVGVVAMLGPDAPDLDARGVAASAAALVMFGLGGVLSRRWADEQPLLHVTAWQLALGSLVLVPVAVLVEGGLPRLDGAGVLGVALSSGLATALAYLCWFGGLRRLPAGAVGVVGLLNPVTGVTLGVLLAGERLGAVQALGTVGVLGAVALAARADRRPAPARARGRERVGSDDAKDRTARRDELGELGTVLPPAQRRCP